MSKELVPTWSRDQKAAFGTRPVVFEHRLADTGLFDDAALADVLDHCDPDLCDINLFDVDADGGHVLRTGSRGSLKGAQVLEGLQGGRLWMQVRRATDVNRAWGAAVDQCYREIGGQLGRPFKPMGVNGQLLLSAPGAGAPMHADAPLVILFHLRGRKRIWIYPRDEAHLPPSAMEAIVLRQQTEELPYRRDMDEAAQVFDLEPGMAISWPLHAPHRVQNLDVACLSLTTEFNTWRSRVTNGAVYTNGVLRRLGLPTAKVHGMPVAARAAMWAASLALKRTGLAKERLSTLERQFVLEDALEPAKAR